MKDPVLELLTKLANEEGRSPTKAILLVAGHIAPNASVSRDMLIGVEVDEDDSRQFGQLLDEPEAGLVSLIDVTIWLDGKQWKVPFLRIDASAVGGWLTGGSLSGKVLPAGEYAWPPG